MTADEVVIASCAVVFGLLIGLSSLGFIVRGISALFRAASE